MKHNPVPSWLKIACVALILNLSGCGGGAQSTKTNQNGNNFEQNQQDDNDNLDNGDHTSDQSIAIVAYQDSNNDGHLPENVFDNDFSDESRWSASSVDGEDPWLQLEFSGPVELTSIDIAFYRGDERSTSFDILASNNGTDWSNVFSGSSSGATNHFESFALAASSASYIRLVGRGNSLNDWTSILELQLPNIIQPAVDDGNNNDHGTDDDSYIAPNANTIAGVTEHTTDTSSADSNNSFYVSNAAELANAIDSVTSGEFIFLTSENYGELTISDRVNNSMVVIVAEPGSMPVFTGLEISDSQNWTISGISVAPRFNSGADRNVAVRLGGSQLVFENSHINYSSNSSQWSANDWLQQAGHGLSVTASESIVRNNIISNVDMGILAGGSGLTVSHNTIRGFRGDGIRALGDNNLFEYNHISNCVDVDDNHDDGIQSYSYEDGVVGESEVANVTMRGNFIIDRTEDFETSHGCHMHGMGFFDGTFVNWRVENNVVVVTHWNGIAFLGAEDVVVTNNTVMDRNSNDSMGPPWIQIASHKNGTAPVNCIMRNNISESNRPQDGALGENNLDASGVEGLFLDPDNFDFRLLAGSPAIDEGTSAGAPAVDHLGVNRPRGDGIDIGAYEYTGQ